MPSSKKIHPLQEFVHKALRAWQEVEGEPDTLLRPLLKVRARHQKLVDEGAPLPQRQAVNEILDEALQKLAQKDEIGAKILREHFLNQRTTLNIAFALGMGEDQVNRRQRKAIETLTEILEQEDHLFRRDEIARIEFQLPPASYSHLFGVQQTLETLNQVLENAAPPWLIAITGLGGSGKTAVADAAVRKILPTVHFDQIAWVRAETHSLSEESSSPTLTFDDISAQLAKQLLPANTLVARPFHLIRQMLKERPHLIVVDNLESEADTLFLFNQLADLGGPSKIMITTRTRPPAQTGVYPLSLAELPLADALALIRHQAGLNGLTELAQASEETLFPIVEVTGGNPLALKLVVSLAQVLPLPRILADLPVGRTNPIEQMYRNIYWKAWQTLSPAARDLLQIMPLVATSGARLEQLQAVSKMAEPDLLTVIHELAARSLLEARGTTWDRRYGIHRLTETFLRTEIVGWPEDSA
ncbi:MAG: hypothetical protein HUU38_22470 [Anaerolineales bacterium]|nr:hypothetical protein [Anaerolineales bacterium]